MPADLSNESRVLIGNEAGRYLATLLRSYLSGVDDKKMVPWSEVRAALSDWADSLEAETKENDEQLAFERGIAKGRATLLASLIEKVEAEPELPGSMPDAVWDRMRDSRQASQEMLRSAVRGTKKNILRLLRTEAETDG